MAVLYKEILVGSTAYPGATAPQLSTLSQVGVSANSPAGQRAMAFIPEFHTYRVVSGSSGSDVLWSWDGINDAGRAPFGPDSAGGLILPQHLTVSYQQVWLRTSAGVTATVGVGLYSKQ